MLLYRKTQFWMFLVVIVSIDITTIFWYILLKHCKNQRIMHVNTDNKLNFIQPKTSKTLKKITSKIIKLWKLINK